jgi:uncharacterized coiled-coil protein SlyX
MWVLNLGKPVHVPALNETMAIELGANLIGEGIIFVIAAGVVYLEYTRQTRKDRVKEETRKEEIQRLNTILEDLYFHSEKQDAQIRELMRTVHDLQGRVIHKPWRKDPPPPPTSPPPHSHSSHPPLLTVPELDIDSQPKQNTSGQSGKPVECSNNGVILQALDYFEYEVRGRQYHILDS